MWLHFDVFGPVSKRRMKWKHYKPIKLLTQANFCLMLSYLENVRYGRKNGDKLTVKCFFIWAFHRLSLDFIFIFVIGTLQWINDDGRT